MKVLYNEIDLYAAQWLRNLIAAGHLPDGDVDERDIRDITPADLEPYSQCHFFAGIGVWPLVLARSGFPTDYPVWSGSCPCQPFSAAGAGKGFTDERHLWPHFHYLIEQCRPAVVVGEQVASKDGLAWFDLVQTDMEGSDYACGAFDTCAAGYGAPHIRQRLYFAGYDLRSDQRLADRVSTRLEGLTGDGNRGYKPGWIKTQTGRPTAARSSYGRVDDATGARHLRSVEDAKSQTWDEAWMRLSDAGRSRSGLGHPHVDAGAIPLGQQRLHTANGNTDGQGSEGSQSEPSGVANGPACATNGYWAAADWLFCRDGKWRPVRPESFPLADGIAARVGRLRAYGNAIVAPQAEEFCNSLREVLLDL